ncbi:MFS transporter [Streptomyces sp. NPDC059900]|uniref:MFS transporter n=1 Tax=Streptomyces sp. NPDC059900 TaxID=3155816 RepID=UPI003422833B
MRPQDAVLATAFLARFAQLGLFSVEVLILLDRGVATERVGVVLTAAAVGSGATQLLLARFGHRLAAARTARIGLLLQAAGCAAFGVVGAWWSFAVADLLVMAGSAAVTTGLRTLVADTASDRTDRGENAFGALTAAQMAGAFAGPLCTGAVVSAGTALAAWPATAATLGAALVLARAAHGPTGARTVAQVGKTQAGRPPRGVPRDAPHGVAGRVWPYAVLLFGVTGLYGGYAVAWSVYLRDLGAPDTVVAWSAAAIALPSLLLSPRVGRLLPHVPRTALLHGAVLLIGGCALLYPHLGAVAPAVALSLVEGALLAVVLPLISAQVAHVAVRAGQLGTPRAFGVLGLADALGSGLGTAVAGVLIAAGGTPYVFRFCGLLCLVCAAVALAAPRPSPSPAVSPVAIERRPPSSIENGR